MLRGKRVTLRATERDDLKRLHELMNREIDQVMLGYGGWRPRSLAEIEKDFDKNAANEDKSWFAIEADNNVIGDCGLKSWNWRRLSGTAELGISILDPAYLSQGYGREALHLLLDWGFRIQNWRRIYLDTLGINERAIRSYRACGFVEEARLRQQELFNGEYVDIVMMGLLREEWEAHQREQADA